MKLRKRLEAWMDHITYLADVDNKNHGLTVTHTSRWGRTYRDPRFDNLATHRNPDLDDEAI